MSTTEGSRGQLGAGWGSHFQCCSYVRVQQWKTLPQPAPSLPGCPDQPRATTTTGALASVDNPKEQLS